MPQTSSSGSGQGCSLVSLQGVFLKIHYPTDNCNFRCLSDISCAGEKWKEQAPCQATCQPDNLVNIISICLSFPLHKMELMLPISHGCWEDSVIAMTQTVCMMVRTLNKGQLFLIYTVFSVPSWARAQPLASSDLRKVSSLTSLSLRFSFFKSRSDLITLGGYYKDFS